MVFNIYHLVKLFCYYDFIIIAERDKTFSRQLIVLRQYEIKYIVCLIIISQ